MAHLSISLLGSFQATLDGRPVTDFGTDKTRALLAYLAVEANRPHRRDALAGLLWAEDPQPRARQSLRQALSRLRQTLGDPEHTIPFLLISRETVQLNPDADYYLDVADFTALSEASEAHHHRRPEACLPCMRHREEMDRLYQGSFLGDFYLSDCNAFEEWAALQREYLQRRMMEALAFLAEYYERRGDVRQAIQVAHRQVQIEPWREEAHRQLMRLLALDGQRSSALTQYGTCRHALAQELGVEPTAETTELYEQIKAQGQVTPEQLTRASASYRHTLPPSSAPFIGREEELAELADLLADPDCRLVTLTGPGGIGKTRLALQVATEQVGLLAHGVAFVPLASVDSADLLVPTIADALRFRFHDQVDPAQQLLGFLREKELLLVLDSMEHVLEGVELVSEILRRAPGVMLLVTSRERLSLHEEWVYEVDGLAHPTDPAAEDIQGYSAIALFVQTARRAQRKFLLTEQESPHVVRICQMVEGMPLAVELAAAWTPVRTCEEMARGLERNLDALTTRLRNAPQRHRSLRAAFEHSWNLLPERERAVFRDLSVFRGGFVEEAAVEVAGASPQALSALVDKSLLRRDGSGRLGLHRLLRQYAEEKLQDMPAQQQLVEDRLCEYYAGFLQQRGAWLRAAKQMEALEEIAAEIDNVRLAFQLGWARARVAALDRSVTSLGTFYAIRSWHQEGARVFGWAVENLSATSPRLQEGSGDVQDVGDAVLGECLAWLGHFRHQLGDHEAAQVLLERSLEILGRYEAGEKHAFSLYTLGQILYFGKNNYPEAVQRFKEGLALYQILNDAYGEAQCLDGLGDVAARQGDHELAQSHYERALALRRQIGDLWGISISLGSLGGLAGRLGRYPEALARFEESLAICQRLENQRGVAASLHNLSTLAYLQEEYAEAKRLRQEALDICRQIGYRWGIASSLKSLGDVAGRLGEYDQAMRHLGDSLALLQEEGDRRSQAYTLNSLGTVAQSMEDIQESRQYFQRALAATIEIGEPALALDILMSLTKLTAQEGDVERALELLAFVFHHPASEQQTRDQIEPLRAKLAHRVSTQAVAAAETRGRALDLNELAATILSFPDTGL
jgi:predicted ATPase/DNA-binding SARP family transcriptional activator/Tfp pilus assembly protein PilF